MIVISSFPSIRGEDIPQFDVPNIDKLFHFVEYFILGVLLVRAFSNTAVKMRYIYICIASILIACLYGCADEFHQRFVSQRTADIFDFLTDAAGAVIGVLLSIFKERISRAIDKTI